MECWNFRPGDLVVVEYFDDVWVTIKAMKDNRELDILINMNIMLKFTDMDESEHST